MAAELLDDVPGGPRREEWLPTLARSAGTTAALLAGRAPASASSPARGHGRRGAARRRGAEGDHPVWLLAEALSTAAVASAVLKGVPGATLPVSALGRLPSPWRRLLATLDVRDPTFRRAVRLGVAVGLAGLAASLLDLGRAYWPVFSVIVILSGPAARDWRRALERLGGTIAGFFVALGLIKLAGTSDALAMGLGLAMLLPGLILVPIRYGAAMLFITAAVGLLYSRRRDRRRLPLLPGRGHVRRRGDRGRHRPAALAHPAERLVPRRRPDGRRARRRRGHDRPRRTARPARDEGDGAAHRDPRGRGAARGLTRLRRRLALHGRRRGAHPDPHRTGERSRSTNPTALAARLRELEAGCADLELTTDRDALGILGGGRRDRRRWRPPSPASARSSDERQLRRVGRGRLGAPTVSAPVDRHGAWPAHLGAPKSVSTASYGLRRSK